MYLQDQFGRWYVSDTQYGGVTPVSFGSNVSGLYKSAPGPSSTPMTVTYYQQPTNDSMLASHAGYTMPTTSSNAGVDAMQAQARQTASLYNPYDDLRVW